MTQALLEFPDPAALAHALAEAVAQRLREGIARRGAASLVVSGGRTPAAFLEALSVAPLDWSRVQVTLADERRVPATSPDSNARLVREHLLRGAASAAHLVPLFVEGEDAAGEAALLAARSGALAAMTRPFDALVLGMGEDGHTASLFPGAIGLEAALDAAAAPATVAISPPAAPHRRVSMNLSLLLDSRWIALHVQGESKRALLARVRQGTPATEHPVAAVLRQDRVHVDVYWAA